MGILEGHRAAAQRRFAELNDDVYHAGFGAQFFSGLVSPATMVIGNLGYVAVCVVGAALAVNGTISFGVIVAFMLYVRLFTQPLSQIAQSMNNLQRTAAASERVFTLLEEPELEREDEKKPTWYS